MYEEHLKRAEGVFGKLKGFDNAPPEEKVVILLRKNNCEYSFIQRWLGNPSKKWIRQTLLKWIPELIDNSKKKKIQDNTEKRIIGILKNKNCYKIDLDEFGKTEFKIDDNKLFFNYDGDFEEFSIWDKRTKESILTNIARNFNIDIKTTEFKND